MSCRCRVTLGPSPFQITSSKSCAPVECVEPQTCGQWFWSLSGLFVPVLCHPHEWKKLLISKWDVPSSHGQAALLCQRTMNSILGTFSRPHWSLRMKWCGFKIRVLFLWLLQPVLKNEEFWHRCVLLSRKADYFRQRGGCCADFLVGLIAGKQGSDSAWAVLTRS